jgi:ribosomal protein S18 acetylase RimI-like enzyme
VTTATHPRPVLRDQHAALLALIEHDRLPGQPALSRAALRQALAGRSPIDGGWWDELTDLHVDTLPAGDEALAGAVSWGYRGDTAVLTWLHAREAPGAVCALLDHALAAHHGPWTAFEFASALTLGVEALPVAHRPVTAAALKARGFTGSDLWRYMHRPLTDLPPRPELTLEVRPGRLDGWELATPDGAGQVELTGPVEGTAMIGWVGVDPAARGRGLGAALLAAGLWHLAEHGATHAVLYVDDDEPGGDRDRRAANRLYDRTGFREIDRLHSYTRP